MVLAGATVLGITRQRRKDPFLSICIFLMMLHFDKEDTDTEKGLFYFFFIFEFIYFFAYSQESDEWPEWLLHV